MKSDIHFSCGLIATYRFVKDMQIGISQKERLFTYKEISRLAPNHTRTLMRMNEFIRSGLDIRLNYKYSHIQLVVLGEVWSVI